MKLSPFLLTLLVLSCTSLSAESRNHIVMIIVDDLNDFVEPLALKNPDGSPREGNIVAYTPNMNTLAQNGVLFSNAHSNSPVCNPSRSSMMHGVLPSTARFYGFDDRKANPVFGGSKTLPKLMNTAPEGETQGTYRTFYTGKTFHVNAPSEYERTNGIKSSQMPRPYNTATSEFVGLPNYPQDDLLINGDTFFGAFGQLDSIYGSLEILNNYPNVVWGRSNKDSVNRYATDLSNPSSKFEDYYPDYASMTDVYDPAKKDLFYYVNDDERDLMVDELSAKYFELTVDEHFSNNGHKDRPIFMAFGIMNPHTPMVAPQSYFDLYPLEDLDLSFLVGNDQSMIADPSHEGGRGNRLYRYLAEAYNDDPSESDKILELKKYLQAYLACTTYADDQIGKVLDYLETKIDPNTGLPMINNTTIVLFADHGYHLGQKEYAWKYSMWDDSTRVPLIISDPRHPATHGEVVDLPVSLVDIYPTVVELGNMEWALNDQITSDHGQPLDGTSLVPFLENPNTPQEEWGGLPMALSMADIYTSNTPRDQVAAVRSTHFRYIRYGSGKDANGHYLYEEFYDYRTDPLELNNIIFDEALYPSYEIEINKHRAQMNALLTDDPTLPWEKPIPGEKFLAGFHTFQDSSPAVPVLNRTTNDTIDNDFLVSVTHGPANSLSTENLLDGMLTETSSDSTYGESYPLLSATGPLESSISMDGRVENYILFKFENQSPRTFRLSALQFDAKFQDASIIKSFSIATVSDPSKLLGNGLAPQSNTYASTSVNSSTGNGQFDTIELNIASVPEVDRTITPGATKYLMLKVNSNGWAAQADSYLDNIAWIGTETNQPLSIFLQPTATDSLGGETATMIANAEGDNLQFQWYKGNSGDTSSPVEGQTTRILEVEFVSEDDEGNYWVRVYNDSETADSQAALLLVSYPAQSTESILAGWHTPSTLSGQFSIDANSGTPESAHLGISDVQCIASNARRAGGQSGSETAKEAQNSSDDTSGTFPMDVDDLPITPASFELDRGNASNRFKLDLELSNNRTEAISLNNLRFDYRRNSATTPDALQVIYISGDLIGVSPNTILATLSSYDDATWHDIDIALISLADRTLGSGETATFQITMGFEGTTTNGDGVFIDNLAFTGSYPVGTTPTPPGQTAFQTWINGFETGGLDRAQDDPDLDQVSNLVEFGRGTNPIVVDGPGYTPYLTSEGINFRINFPIANADLRYTLQQSSDLVDWTDTTFIPGSFESGEWQDQFILNVGEPNFLRIKVGY
jgi:arylsulfatase A-like enzyme